MLWDYRMSILFYTYNNYSLMYTPSTHLTRTPEKAINSSPFKGSSVLWIIYIVK